MEEKRTKWEMKEEEIAGEHCPDMLVLAEPVLHSASLDLQGLKAEAS